jgi:hypothetical protein
MLVLDMAVPVMFSPPFEIIRMHTYIRYLCLLAYTGVLHILCCGFFFFLFLVASFSGLSFLIAPLIFSNVYLNGDVITPLFLKYIGWSLIEKKQSDGSTLITN